MSRFYNGVSKTCERSQPQRVAPEGRARGSFKQYKTEPIHSLERPRPAGYTHTYNTLANVESTLIAQDPALCAMLLEETGVSPSKVGMGAPAEECCSPPPMPGAAAIRRPLKKAPDAAAAGRRAGQVPIHT